MVEPKNKLPLRWAGLGGLEEVGRNCMFFEYKNEIIVVDLGLQFPDEETPGVDYILPNVSYLEEKKEDIRALVITHGHYDHIGAIPYLMDKIGNPPIYCGRLTKEIILKRQEEFDSKSELKFVIVQDKQKIKLSKYFQIEFFEVIHSIPDTFGFILNTPIGKLVHFAEFKLPHRKKYLESDLKNSLKKYQHVFNQDIHTLFLESTNAEVEGYSVPEEEVVKNLDEIFKKSPGRIIVATFASLISRIDTILKLAIKHHRKVSISGRTMEDNVKIAQRLGYLKIPEELIIPKSLVNRYPDNKLVLLVTGAQGEPTANLMRIANSEHRWIKIKPKQDTVVFSSSIIPGNERNIEYLKDKLAKQKVKIYCVKVLDIHSGGHAPREELRLIIKNTKPRFFVPIHGSYYMRALNRQIGIECDIPESNIFLPANGEVLNLFPESIKFTMETIPSSYSIVDGLTVEKMKDIVLRDRKLLAQGGIVVIVSTIKRGTTNLVKNPDVISRGFIYLRANKELVDEIKQRVRQILKRLPTYKPLDLDYFKTLVRQQIENFLYKKTRKRPMVVATVVEV